MEGKFLKEGMLSKLVTTLDEAFALNYYEGL